MSKLTAEIERLRFDLEKATESRKQAQNDLYDARERFQKELLRRTGEISRLLKERDGCEPFGYFRPEPFGWTDCAQDDEGAIPLYTAPQKREPDELCKSCAPVCRGGVGCLAGMPPAEKIAIVAFDRPQTKRKPLSDEQINQIRRAIPFDEEDRPDPWDFSQGFRAAEKAHGIEGQS